MSRTLENNLANELVAVSAIYTNTLLDDRIPDAKKLEVLKKVASKAITTINKLNTILPTKSGERMYGQTPLSFIYPCIKK